MPAGSVVYFARAREATGGLVEETFDVVDSDEVRVALVKQHPGLETVLRSAVLAVNQEYCVETTALRERDEVAVIPPISGG